MRGESMLDAALQYAELGYPVFPCVPMRKVPLTPNGRNAATTDEEQIRAWWTANPRANIGLVTDGLVVIDIDGKDNPWPVDQEAAADLANAPTSVTPRGGRHHVYRAPDGKAYKSTASRLAEDVDTRAVGGYICVQPSILDNGEYQWIDGLELDIPRDKLPTPPAWLEQMLANLERGREAGKAPQTIVGDSNPIPDGQRNDTLMRLAGGMRRQGMSRFEIRDALLRANSDRCCPPLLEREVEEIARSVSRYPADQITVALVEGHWQQMTQTDKVKVIAESPTDPGEFPKYLLQVPGLIGQAMQYIDDISYRPQPVLALGASLALMSLLAGRKVRDEYNTRPNLYALGVAHSGQGKEAARQAIKNLLHPIGKLNLVGEGLASHSGLVNAMQKEPSMIWLIDEIGRWLRSVSGASADKAPHLSGIVTNLLKFYSSSGSVYFGDSYADTQKRIEIDQPNAVLYGTTVPDNLFGSMSAESVTDGFLGRLLIFEAGQQHVRKRKPRVVDAPIDLADLCRAWLNWKSQLLPNPTVITCTPGAAAILDDMDARMDDFHEHGPRPWNALWSRASEKARKLALLYACSKALPDGISPIDEDAANWAIDLATYLTKRLIWIASSWIGESEFDRRRKRVVRAIREAGTEGLTMSQLTRKTQGLSIREREEVIAALKQSQEIVSEADNNSSTKTGPKPVRLKCLEFSDFSHGG